MREESEGQKIDTRFCLREKGCLPAWLFSPIVCPSTALERRTMLAG